MKRKSLIILSIVSLLAATAGMAAAVDKDGTVPVSKYFRSSAHGDPDTGVMLIKEARRGSCIQCHSSPEYPYSLFTDNDNNLCYQCHAGASPNYPAGELLRDPDGFFSKGRWPGRDVYENSLHWKQDTLVYPGTDYEPGDCKNCHNPHGTGNKAMLKASYEKNNYRICLDCHGRAGAMVIMPDSARFIEDYYTIVGAKDSAPGHKVTMSAKQSNDFTRAKLDIGDTLPCYDCHNAHGSRGGTGINPNGSLLSDERPEWDGLADTLGDPAQARAFCFGCHVSSDGTPFSKEVEGIRMNKISALGYSATDEHSSAGTASCYQCHGGNYSDERSMNVHNIGYGS